MPWSRYWTKKGYFTVRADSLTDAGELFQQVIVDMVVLDLEQKEFAGKEDVAAIWGEYLPRPGAGKAAAIDSAGKPALFLNGVKMHRTGRRLYQKAL